jgi:hypothetical protein
VFKRLMEDIQTAKFIISTLLGQPVVSIETKAQELTYTPEEGTKKKKPNAPVLSLMRLDFVATIETKTGEYKKVLIEMQKSLSVIDIIRFRDYLGEHYKRRDIVNGQPSVLPIINIYILDDILPIINTACVRVDREYYDAVNDKFLTDRDFFIERLSHDCVVVQTPRIDGSRNVTKLDKLLSVFEQKNFVGKEIYKDYPYSIDNEDIRRMIDILHYCASNAEERKKIEAEHEAWRVYMLVQQDSLQKMGEQTKSIIEKDNLIAEKETVIAEKETVIAEKESVIFEQETVIAEQKTVIAEKETVIAEKDNVIAEKEALLAREQEANKRILAEKEALLARLSALENSKKT